MDLRDLWRTVTRHWLIGGLAAVCVIGSGLAAAYLPEKTYRTSATVVIDPPATDSDLTIAEINFLLPALQQWTQSRGLREAAAENVQEQFRTPPARIEALIDSSVMRVVATASSPLAAQEWANAVTNELIEQRSFEAGGLELTLLDDAPLRRNPISPNPEPIVVAAVALAVIAALFAALLADRIKQSFDTRHAVRERLGATVLGEIPRLNRFERRSPIINLLRSSQSSDELMSAFESLRINVEFRLSDRDSRSVSIVSLSQSDGKSTVAAGLACALAKVGRRVVAVEADLRRPALAEQLRVPHGHGLGDIVASGDDRIVLHPAALSNLSVLTAGIPVGRAADVVATGLPGVVDALSEDPSQLVLIDSPPLRGAPESAIVVANAPNVILVIGSERADLDGLSDAVARISDAGGYLLGIVINRVPPRRVRKDSYPEPEVRSASSSTAARSAVSAVTSPPAFVAAGGDQTPAAGRPRGQLSASSELAARPTTSD